MMTLGALLDRVDELGEDSTIYARRPWTCESEAFATSENDVDLVELARTGVAYLLEVSIAREVIDVWRSWRAGSSPTSLDRCMAVIHYALHDAYLPADGTPRTGN
jgi:hypothetical protein